MAMAMASRNERNQKKHKCRIWWPEQLSCYQPRTSPTTRHDLLFGWCFHAADTLQIVVASRIPSALISASFPRFDDLQKTLILINGKMPYRLQTKANFTLIGCCTVPETTFTSEKELNGDAQQGCSDLQRATLINSGTWVEILLSESKHLSSYKEGMTTVPVVHSLLIGPMLFEICDCHVIFYEISTLRKHHYILSPWGISQERSPRRKPRWIEDLENKSVEVDLESVILALNCSNYAKSSIEEQAWITKPVTHSFRVTISDVVWHCLALSLASGSTIAYLVIQWLHKLLCWNSGKGLIFLRKILPYSCNNVHLRSCQFLYWPILLHSNTSSLFPNVEFSHRCSLQKHFIFWSISADITFGTLLSILVFANTNPISYGMFSISHILTDSILRSGCVWLMGVPAGFKLNTELAGVLGMVSLNAIQVYSTIWYFIGSSILGCLVGLFITAGVGLGLTLQLALLVDLVNLVTLHVASLRWLVSILYSRQIQALASLWRIFRGRKWNPLRQRLDSYDYTVEQHVVGSLIFSPLLLLLPTTSVFYIFFTILNTITTLVCISIELLISVLYVTPYHEIFLWILNKRRFPSGIWFSNVSISDEVVVSLLHTNHAKLGELVRPHYKKMFSAVPSSFVKSIAYGVLTGERIPSNLNTSMPLILPWMKLGFIEYWKLCYDSIIALRYVHKKGSYC